MQDEDFVPSPSSDGSSRVSTPQFHSARRLLQNSLATADFSTGRVKIVDKSTSADVLGSFASAMSHECDITIVSWFNNEIRHHVHLHNDSWMPAVLTTTSVPIQPYPQLSKM